MSAERPIVFTPSKYRSLPGIVGTLHFKILDFFKRYREAEFELQLLDTAFPPSRFPRIPQDLIAEVHGFLRQPILARLAALKVESSELAEKLHAIEPFLQKG